MQPLLKFKKEVREFAKRANLDERQALRFFSDRFCTCRNDSIFPFELRPYQKEDIRAFKSRQYVGFYDRTSRRGGKDSKCWPMTIDAALEYPGNYMYCFITVEQANKVIWLGGMQDKEKGHMVKFMDMLPMQEIKTIDKQKKIIEFKNKSVIYLAGANHADRMRGVSLNGAVYSEFDFYPSYEIYYIMQPVFIESKGWQYIISTVNNVGYASRLFNRFKSDKNWRVITRTVEDLVDENGERYITDEDVQRAAANANMPDWMIRREFYCEPALDTTTLYFGAEMADMEKERRCTEEILPDTRHPIHFAMDLGMDGTPIIGFQVKLDGRINIVFYHKPINEVKTYSWYWNTIKEFAIKKNLCVGKLILPHDSVKRQISESKITSAYGDFSALGADVVKLKRVGNKDSLINLAKAYLPKIHIDKKQGESLVDALCAYSRKYDADRDVYGDRPVHDWSSHPADCLQYVVQAIEERKLAGASSHGQKYNVLKERRANVHNTYRNGQSGL